MSNFELLRTIVVISVSSLIIVVIGKTLDYYPLFIDIIYGIYTSCACGILVFVTQSTTVKNLFNTNYVSLLQFVVGTAWFHFTCVYIILTQPLYEYIKGTVCSYSLYLFHNTITFPLWMYFSLSILQQNTRDGSTEKIAKNMVLIFIPVCIVTLIGMHLADEGFDYTTQLCLGIEQRSMAASFFALSQALQFAIFLYYSYPLYKSQSQNSIRIRVLFVNVIICLVIFPIVVIHGGVNNKWIAGIMFMIIFLLHATNGYISLFVKTAIQLDLII